jgi:L-aminopeptidase/D-esterase-like protein
MTITAIPGVRVGHWTDPVARTGCTVVVLPEPNVTTVEVRGGAPGSRETDLLAPGRRVEQVQAILLTGGSAFGLAAADGVMAELATEGRGHPTLGGPVPIVPAAVVYDLMVGDGSVRPGPEEGALAFRNAGDQPVEMGLVGAGTGTTVAKWRGMEYAVAGGIGTALHEIGGAKVGALAVLNSVGDVFTLDGLALTGGDHFPSEPRPPEDPLLTNTTLVVVATDARLSRTELMRLCVRAHDGVGACVRPAHTAFDGDVVFATSCGEVEADVTVVAEGAFIATGRAIEAAIKASNDVG